MSKKTLHTFNGKNVGLADQMFILGDDIECWEFTCSMKFSLNMRNIFSQSLSKPSELRSSRKKTSSSVSRLTAVQGYIFFKFAHISQVLEYSFSCYQNILILHILSAACFYPIYYGHMTNMKQSFNSFKPITFQVIFYCFLIYIF